MWAQTLLLCPFVIGTKYVFCRSVCNAFTVMYKESDECVMCEMCLSYSLTHTELLSPRSSAGRGHRGLHSREGAGGG